MDQVFDFYGYNLPDEQPPLIVNQTIKPPSPPITKKEAKEIFPFITSKVTALYAIAHDRGPRTQEAKKQKMRDLFYIINELGIVFGLEKNAKPSAPPIEHAKPQSPFIEDYLAGMIEDVNAIFKTVFKDSRNSATDARIDPECNLHFNKIQSHLENYNRCVSDYNAYGLKIVRKIETIMEKLKPSKLEIYPLKEEEKLRVYIKTNIAIEKIEKMETTAKLVENSRRKQLEKLNILWNTLNENLKLLKDELERYIESYRCKGSTPGLFSGYDPILGKVKLTPMTPKMTFIIDP